MTTKKATKKKANPVGRPPKYKKEFCQKLIDHMSKGFSYEGFAGKIDTHRDTLYHWEKLYPEFSDAKKKAFIKCMNYWEEMGMAGTVGKIKGFSTPMWIFNMKNRFKWADRHEHAVDTDQNEIKLKYDPKA